MKKKKKVFVTFKMLEKFGACVQARSRFTRLFGERAEVTADNVKLWRETSSREGMPGQDCGWIIWFLLRDRGSLSEAFVKRVKKTSRPGLSNRWLVLNEATIRVGRNYSPERCAEAIRQTLQKAARR